ncbi:MAG: hypothetical protein DRI83_04035 [Bacteroidetes bacterium]|nr:MAG: hypothetical protein DRI83_04035 [Bacteroidota bacterium]
MKIKINWGTGILIFLVIFFIAIFSFVYFSFQLQINLVEDDYYPKEITYQKQIDKMHNLEVLGEKISIRKEEGILILTFPEVHKSKFEGKIHIYRPSDAGMDKVLEIVTDQNNRQFIPVDQLINGKYILKIDWVCEGTGYYQEIVFIK